MEWGFLLEKGLEVAGAAIQESSKPTVASVDGKDIVSKIDTPTASHVVGDVLSELTSRTDNNIDNNVVEFVLGMIGNDNIDDLVIGLLETLAKKTNNNVDDAVVKLVSCYIKKCNKE